MQGVSEEESRRIREENALKKVLPIGSCTLQDMKKFDYIKNFVKQTDAVKLVLPLNHRYSPFLIIRKQLLREKYPQYQLFHQPSRTFLLIAQEQSITIGCCYLISSASNKQILGKLRGNFQRDEFNLYDEGDNPDKVTTRPRKHYANIQIQASILSKARKMQLLVPKACESLTSKGEISTYEPLDFVCRPENPSPISREHSLHRNTVEILSMNTIQPQNNVHGQRIALQSGGHCQSGLITRKTGLSINDCSRFWSDSGINREPVIMRRLDCALQYFNNRTLMGKKDRKPKQQVAPKVQKHKQITHSTSKNTKNIEEQPANQKNLFQIIPENDEGEDAFAALPYEEESSHQIPAQKKKNKNKFKQQVKEVAPPSEEEQEEEILQPQNQEQFDDQIEQGEGEELDEQFQEQFDEDGQDIEGQEEEQQLAQEGEQNEVGEEGGDQQLEDVDCDGQPIQNNGPPDENVDISVINLQIQQTINILLNVGKLGGGRPRKYFVEQLRGLLHRYYGYNFELIDHFLNFLNPAELVQFFEANQTQRPLTIRTNTIKTRRKELAQNLIQRGVNLDPLAEWSKVGIKIYESKVPIGATPEYLAGHYMLQSASSFLPVLALDPQVGERILDMASAPGGKTTYIAQIMKNTGCIFANDLKAQRLKALKFNLYRLGITNTVVTCRDGRKYPTVFPGSFDRVLLDAPCTGLGIISKDPSIKANRLLLDIYKNSHVQKQLLLAAIDCVKVGGVVVYSTCSVSPLENEQVVNYALKKRHVKIVDCEIEVGEQGLTKFVQKRYHVDLRRTRRIYPHVHNMDGFYVAKLVKVAKGQRNLEEQETQ